MRIFKACKDGKPFMCIAYKSVIAVQRMSPTSVNITLAGSPVLFSMEVQDEEYMNQVFDDICEHMGMEDWIDGKV